MTTHPNSVRTVYPVLQSTDPAATRDFFVTWFGFAVTFDADWYVSLRVEPGFELGIVAADHPTIPTGHAGATRQMLINVEVDDVDAWHDRLVTRGSLAAVRPLRSEDFGQRHFIVSAPGDVLVDVITPIEPAAAFADAFTAAAV